MNSSPHRRSLGPRSKMGGIAVVVLVGVYSLAAPYINDRFGLDLPAIRADSNGQVRVVDAEPGSQRAAVKEDRAKEDSGRTSPSATPTTKPGTSKKARGPLADRMRPSSRGDKKQSAPQQSKASPSNSQQSGSGEDNLYGLLRDVGRNTYLSPAGLRYTPGSAEGHRLDHLERHTKDDPGRPGSHGVFDGGMEGALKTIDKAYERAKKGQRTTKKKDDGRTIYTVDMGGRVGFVGGRDGNRKRKPMARRVRIVLDGDRVITAYPM